MMRLLSVPARWAKTASRNFLFTIAAFFFRIALSMPGALYAIYRVRVLGASDAWIGTLLTAERLASVLGYFVLARFLHRETVRRWLWVSCAGMIFFPLTTAMRRYPPRITS